MKSFLAFILLLLLTAPALAQDSTSTAKIDIKIDPLRPKSLIGATVPAEQDNQYVYVHILNFTGTAFIEIKNAAGVSGMYAVLDNVFKRVNHKMWFYPLF